MALEFALDSDTRLLSRKSRHRIVDDEIEGSRDGAKRPFLIVPHTVIEECVDWLYHDPDCEKVLRAHGLLVS